MKKMIFTVLILANTFTGLAAPEAERATNVRKCDLINEKISNADRSFFKHYYIKCKNIVVNAIGFQGANSNHEKIILHDVSTDLRSHSGYKFLDFDKDGIFEIDHVLDCGTVNCGHRVYKLKENYSPHYLADDDIYIFIEGAWFHLDINKGYVVADERGSISDYYSRIYLLSDEEVKLPISYEIHNKTHVDSVKYCLIKKYTQSDSKEKRSDSFVFLTKKEVNEEFKKLCEPGSIITTEEPKCTESTPC